MKQHSTAHNGQSIVGVQVSAVVDGVFFPFRVPLFGRSMWRIKPVREAHEIDMFRIRKNYKEDCRAMATSEAVVIRYLKKETINKVKNI